MLFYKIEVFKQKKHNFFLWIQSIYILKSFKSHIEKILCYPFKLKYLNKNKITLYWKDNFFLVNIKYIYERVSNSILKK